RRRRLRRIARTAVDVVAGGRVRAVRVNGVLLAHRKARGPLAGVGELSGELRAATSAAADRAACGRLALCAVASTAPAADVLVLPLILMGLGVIGDIGRRGRVRRLRRRARTGVHVAARDCDGGVPVDRVLVAVRHAKSGLLGVGLLYTELEAARAS